MNFWTRKRPENSQLRRLVLLWSFVWSIGASVSAWATDWKNLAPPLPDLVTQVPGTALQLVEPIPPGEIIKVHFNPGLVGAECWLEGWNGKIPGQSQDATARTLFGVRTMANSLTPADTDMLYFQSKGVGRSGIWETVEPGKYFMKYKGQFYKGLTIKGYGGNQPGKPLQQAGSLEFKEAMRDTILSNVLLENGVDSYVGFLYVERAGGKANFVRLSRSAYRLNDLIDRTGPDLAQVVDHLSSLLTDEVGKKMTPSEFYDWLARSTAESVAGAEYLRFTVSNTNKDNVGIGELVDFGEAELHSSKVEFEKAYTDYSGKTQSASIKDHVKTACDKLAKEFQLTKTFDAVYDSAFATGFKAMEATDAARIDLAAATLRDLMTIGLDQNTAEKIIKHRDQADFGLLTREDAMTVKGVSEESAQIIWNKTKTSLITLEGGRMLPSAFLGTMGGTSGVRSVLTSILLETSRTGANITDKAAVQKIVSEKLSQAFKNFGDFQAAFYTGSPLDFLIRQITGWIETTAVTAPLLLQKTCPGLLNKKGGPVTRFVHPEILDSLLKSAIIGVC